MSCQRAVGSRRVAGLQTGAARSVDAGLAATLRSTCNARATHVRGSRPTQRQRTDAHECLQSLPARTSLGAEIHKLRSGVAPRVSLHTHGNTHWHRSLDRTVTTTPTCSRLMRFVVPVALVLVAAIHALPVIGVLGANKLAQLYGVTAHDPNPELHRLALLAGPSSNVSFLALAPRAGVLSAGVMSVVRADWFTLVLLLLAAAVHLKR